MTTATVTTTAITPALELLGVTKMYGEGEGRVTAVDSATLSVQPGECVIILGPSGSGKSTLLTLAGCLSTPTSGTISIDGTDVAALTPGERDTLRLNNVGFILQSHNLVPFLTVREQFELVDKVHTEGNMTDDERDALLEDLGIAHLMDATPASMSGGQQQRVAIARALYTKPALVLADEPTAALDTTAAMNVGHILKDVAVTRSAAVVIVTHDQRLVPLADAVYSVTDGRLARVNVSRETLER